MPFRLIHSSICMTNACMKIKVLTACIWGLHACLSLSTAKVNSEPINQSKPTRQIEMEWIAPASQAENVVDMLDSEATLSIQQSPKTDTRAFPVAVVIVGIFAAERITSLLVDLYRNSKPGAILELDKNGKVKITQSPSLPRGCIIDNINKKPGCLFPDKKATDGEMKALIGSLITK
jgi:hypothetical protein